MFLDVSSSQAPEQFKAEYWEQKPTVFQATAARKAFFTGVFGIDTLRTLAQQRLDVAAAAAKVGGDANFVPAC